MSILSQTKKILDRTAPAAGKSKGKKEAKKDTKVTYAVVPVQSGRIGLRPMVTEKSVNRSQANNTVVFRVNQGTSKGQIMTAVLERYQVKPVKVRTVTMVPKTRRRGKSEGMTNHWKKAYVTLPADANIDLSA